MKTNLSQMWGDQLAKALEGVTPVEKGAPGSGHFGHAGRKGLVGGSEPGGVLVGRADADDADEQFKFSGNATLTRAKGHGVEVSIKGKSKGSLVVHGISDGGKTVKGKAVLALGNKSVEVDHDELHAIRSKMRWVQTANDKDIKEIGGRNVARGHSVEVKIGEKAVSIPVNAKSLDAVDRAVKATKMKGYSLAAEPHSLIAKAVRDMRSSNPVSVVKTRGFSKAGQFASFMTHVEQHSDADLKKMLRARQMGASPMQKAALDSVHKDLIAARATARANKTNLSGTQAARFYRQAATLVTVLGRK